MLKSNHVLLSAFLLLFFSAMQAQSLSPIAQMVAQAKTTENFKSLSFFKKETKALDAMAEQAVALPRGTILQWDESRYQILMAEADAPLLLSLPWENGAKLDVELVPAKNFSDEFSVHTATGGDAAQDVERGLHYWGIVKDNPNSLVCISLFKNEMAAMISFEGGRYTIGALPNSATKAHILYKDTDLNISEPFKCFADESLRPEAHEVEAANRVVGPTNCVKMFIECDYTLFQNKGSVANVVTYMTSVMSQVSALYTNESVNLVLNDIYVWNVTDPYTGPTSSDYLNQFRTAKNGVFNGSLAHLVGINGLGGIAYLDVLCNPAYGVGYSSINATYSNVPTYSWTVEVMTHEIGHNLGSSHTHACVWNGNNTAIDGCGPTAGYSEGCTAALPTNGGTIMSYCHLLSNVGINFNNGFGTQPGDRIRTQVYNAPCLSACGGGGGGCTYVNINSQNFETGWGIWTDGGNNCDRISNATYANSPTYCVRLKNGNNGSNTYTASQSWAGYNELTLDFSYITTGCEAGDKFVVQLLTSGTTYSTYATFTFGSTFTNNVRKSGHVVIPGPFTATTRLRIQNSSNANDDLVYIDDAVIMGCQAQFAPNGQSETRNGQGAESLAAAGISQMKTGPNPNSGNLNIQFDAADACELTLSLTDLSGKIVLQNQLQALNGFNRLNIPTEALGNGMYILNIRAGGNLFTEKMIIAK